jgi:hypothetical protein
LTIRQLGDSLIEICVFFFFSFLKYVFLITCGLFVHLITYFCPSCGIRQGGPLSPYLFIICAKTLSSILSQTKSTCWIVGVPTSPKGPKLNHLFFTDDNLLFCKATTR